MPKTEIQEKRYTQHTFYSTNLSLVICRKKLQIRVTPPALLLKSYPWPKGSSAFLFIGRETICHSMIEEFTYHSFGKVIITRPLLFLGAFYEPNSQLYSTF